MLSFRTPQARVVSWPPARRSARGDGELLCPCARGRCGVPYALDESVLAVDDELLRTLLADEGCVGLVLKVRCHSAQAGPTIAALRPPARSRARAPARLRAPAAVSRG